MRINLEILLILCDIYDAVPLRTAKRIAVIYEFTSKILENEKLSGCDVLVDVHDENLFQDQVFELTMENIARLE